MSFCSDIKESLAKIRTPECCKEPFAYGLLLFGRSFSAKKVGMQTECEASANCYCDLLNRVYGVETTINVSQNKKTIYKASVESEADRLKILASVDFGVYEGKINRESFERDCCASSFIRGAFLSCGYITNPESQFRVDFYVRDINLAQEFVNLLSEHFITARISKRQSGCVVYIKKSEMIINLMTVMGASAKSLELIEMTIINGVKNNMNRARNCDSANIGKTVEASIRQRKAIQFLQNKGMLDSLPPELIAAAQLRLQNPQESLKELCKKSQETITVSGLNHRLRKIMSIYEEYNKK